MHPSTRPTALVIGGGPGGLMAAEVLARGGVAVTIVERHRSVARTLLLAGRSGLNLTHTEDLERFLDHYGPARPVLEPAIRAFGPAELRAWCAGLGEVTFVGSSGRVFPESFRATPLVRAWLGRLDELGVVVRTGATWRGWPSEDVSEDDGAVGPRTAMFDLDDGGEEVHRADLTVFALGGASWPRVGGDGGWVTPFRRAGIDVRELRASNVGVLVDWTPGFVDRFHGTPVKDVVLTVGDVTARGDLVVTRTGLESGPIYAASRPIRDALDHDGVCTASVDLRPDRSVERLAHQLGRRRTKDTTTSWIRRATGLEPVAIGMLREATVNQLPTDPSGMASLVKAVPVRIVGTAPIDRAISSAGGVVLDEVDADFMLRRLPGTYVIGEMLDWDAPTGGYLLQATLATAARAATSALHRLGVSMA